VERQLGSARWASALLRMMPRLCLQPAVVLFVFLMALLPDGQARAEEDVTLQVLPQDGYGRMILTFKDRTLLPYYDAVVTSNVLRISFENPILVDVDDVPLELGDYVTIARRDPDGSAIRFALKEQFRINTLEAGEKLFVDILPSNWQGLPPGLPDDVVRELAKRAEEAMRKVRALEQARLKVQDGPQVDLRIGTHPTFTRLVFDWSVRFDTAFVREDDFIRVTFNHPAQLDISDLRAHLPPGVVDASSFLDKGKLKFLMRIDPDVDIRAFREDQTYVIDITPKEMPPADEANKRIDEAFFGPSSGQMDDLIVANGVRNEAPEPAPWTDTSNPVVSPARQQQGSPAAPVELVEQQAGEGAGFSVPVNSAPEAGLSGDVTAENPVQEPVAVQTAEVAQTEQPAQRAPAANQPVPGRQTNIPPAIDLTPTRTSNDTQPWRANLDEATLPGDVSPESPPANHALDIKNLVSAEARRIGNTIRIVFPFREPVSSAVFRRNDSIWLVFDTDTTIDLRGMSSALSDTAGTIDLIRGEDHQVIRLDMNNPVLATVGLDGNAWNLVIGDLILEPSRPLKLERNVRADGGSVLRVLYKGPQNIRSFQDPFVGDTISVVTGHGPPRGLLKPQKFVDLDALSSAHGVAIAARSDGVSVELLGDDVIIEKAGGLALSNNKLRGGSGVFNTIADPNDSGYVEFVSLATEDPHEFHNRLRELERKLASAPEGRRRGPLMDLARYYLAHQFAQEAQGLMKLAVEEDPVIAEESAFNLMMGAAQTLANRPEEAYGHLNRPELKNSPDAAVWQTIVDVAVGNWTGARIAMPRGRAVVGNYPQSIQTEFNLSAAQAMVEVNDFGMANAILAEIEPSTITGSQAARYDILRGRVADASGRSQEALAVFDLVAKTGDRPRAAEARYRALRIRYRDGEFNIDETIDDLAGLATSWRGDEIELKTLRFLAQLYAEKGRYREAFEAMKSAVQADPDADTTRLLQEEMNGLFIALFLDGKADELPPVKALSLYYDFREMTPIGRQGDEMVRGLAKRLVEVDLLSQAAELLRHQVDNRLKGAARAQIAADLAAIYLMDRKPEQALRVLNLTRQASLPSSLERQRNIVEARALTESGRPDLALELVRNMRGSDVDRLRADTFWAAQSWREAGEQLEAMHGSRWSDVIPLETLERHDILKAGIAYSLAGDQLSLNRLQTKYASKMADSPEALAFEVVTRPIEQQGVEFLEVANGLASTETLDTFLEEYRRQYMTPSASADQAARTEGETPEAG